MDRGGVALRITAPANGKGGVRRFQNIGGGLSLPFFLFGFTIILVAPGVTILPPEITRRAVLFGVKFCLREKPLSSPLPSAGLCADPWSRVGLAFVLPYAVLSIAILGIRGTRAGPTRTRPTGRPGFNSSPYRPAYPLSPQTRL